MNDIIEELKRFNPWWNGTAPQLPDPLIERELFNDLMQGIERSTVQSITGLRRVGKTTLMMQVITSLLRTVKPERVLYFSFDLTSSEHGPGVRDIMEEYLTSILLCPLKEVRDPVYILLDEVHLRPGWSREVKYYMDLQPMLRFMVTGSSSMHILRGAGESLIGRMSPKHLYPFSFKEFLTYHGIHVREDFDLFGVVEQTEKRVPSFINGERLRIEFNRYLEVGGMPGLYPEETMIEQRNIIKNCLDLTLFRDLLEVYDIRQPKRLASLFQFLISNSARVVNYSTISNALGIKYETLQHYLEYLERSHLIHVTAPYSENVLKRISRNPKVYIGDHSFFLLNGPDQGHAVETVVFNHVHRLTAKRLIRSPYYWVNKKGEEVDIVVVTDMGVLPIEVKYRSSIKWEDLKGLQDLMRKNDVLPPIIITKDEEGIMELKRRSEPHQIFKIPLWKFLLSS